MAIMETRELVYAYQTGRPVLKGLNLKFEEGNMYVILGPSGCGKTTLLSLLGGLDQPQSGEVLFRSEPIDKIGLGRHRQKNVSFIFQNYNLIDYMTPEENVLLTAKIPPLPILEKLGLTPEECRRNVMKLSGGQQQRVAIARALASESPVILADEPTGNLDSDMACEITKILKDMAKEYRRCVVVSHSKDIADQADVVLELKNGEVTIALS